MLDVAIVGAGELGGSLAQLLATKDSFREIRLIDGAGTVAKGKALDVAQSSGVSGFSTRVSGASDLMAAAGVSVIVLADRVETGEWHGEEGQLALRQIAHFAETAVILCAGASHLELVEHGVRRLGYHRNRLFGSAPEALASAIRAIVALETDASPRDVALSVLGVPPSRIVVPWEETTVAGAAFSRVLGEPERRRIAAKISALWPPGARTLAAAALKTLSGMLGPSRQSVSAFVAPDDAHGVRRRAAALRVRLGPHGIERVLDPRLRGQDQVAFDNATLL